MKTVFVLRQLFTNLWRERTPVLATILTISIAIIILVTLCEAGFRIYDELNRLKRDLAIEIYVSPNLSEDETESVSRKLNKFQSIESMRYISKEKAADIFESEFGEDIYDILEENPLPASFEIKLKEEFNHESYLSLFKKQVSDINGVDEIHYRHTVLENLENIMEMVVIIGIGAFIMLFLAMTLLIRNTVKLSVYSRRRQIEIMKTLGAGQLFIRMPFILEGLFEGLLGGSLSGIALVVLHKLIMAAFPLIDLPNGILGALWIISLLSGALFGTLVAAAAAGKYTSNPYYNK